MMIMGSRRAVLVVLFCVALLGVTALPAVAAPQRVVILPFSANAASDISYLTKGLRDMLASRLAWQDKVTVIEQDLVNPVMKNIPGPYSASKARAVGKELSAQAVVFGSVTMFGKAVSLDAQLVRVEGDSAPLSTFVQANSLDEVIPKINQFAQRINAEIFKRPEAIAAQNAPAAPAAPAADSQAAPAAPAPSAPLAPLASGNPPAPQGPPPASGAPGQPKPEEGVRDRSDLVGKLDSPASQWKPESTDLEELPANISPLNPMFLKQLSGVESDRHWRSPTIKGQIQSICVADIDGDGKNELVAALKDGLLVYRLSKDNFQQVYEIKNGPLGQYLFVDAGDIDGDGIPEVYVSNMYNHQCSSFIMVWKGNGLQVRDTGLPYFFRVQKNPLGKGDILLAQGKNIAEAYAGPIYRMGYKGGKLVEEKELQLPETAWIFSMVLANLNGSGSYEPVVVGPGFDLQVYSSQGEDLWKSNDVYSTSSKIIDQPNRWSVNDRLADDEAWTYVPTRMINRDLDGDGREEVIVIHNKDRANLMMERLTMFYQGNILSMIWNGLNMTETWRTPRISGYLADFTIADVGNVGRQALVMAVAKRSMKGYIPSDKSFLVAFTLKPPKEPKKIENKGL